MALRFGAFVPQGWRMDLGEIQDPIEKRVSVNYFMTYFPRIAYDHEPIHCFAEEVAPLLKG